MKFFIGIVPPLVTRERILDFQKNFPSNKVWMFSEPHITLKGPSGLTEDKRWLAKILTLVGNYPRFQIKFEGIESFDSHILFLKPAFSPELMDLHLKLVSLLDIDKEDQEKFFEGPLYNPHLTLGESTWGGMTEGELVLMKKRAETELWNIPPFQVDFIRVDKKENPNDSHQKLLDIPLKL